MNFARGRIGAGRGVELVCWWYYQSGIASVRRHSAELVSTYSVLHPRTIVLRSHRTQACGAGGLESTWPCTGCQCHCHVASPSPQYSGQIATRTELPSGLKLCRGLLEANLPSGSASQTVHPRPHLPPVPRVLYSRTSCSYSICSAPSLQSVNRCSMAEAILDQVRNVAEGEIVSA